MQENKHATTSTDLPIQIEIFAEMDKQTQAAEITKTKACSDYIFYAMQGLAFSSLVISTVAISFPIQPLAISVAVLSSVNIWINTLYEKKTNILKKMLKLAKK